MNFTVGLTTLQAEVQPLYCLKVLIQKLSNQFIKIISE